jgi:anti-anti-sigma factor
MDENLDAQIENEGDVAVVSFNAVSLCDIGAIERVAKQLRQYIAESRPKKMVIDFSQVKFFTSQTLGLLLDIWRKLESEGGQVVISGINPQLHRVFKITNLDKIFKFFPDRQSAVNAFQNNIKGEG